MANSVPPPRTAPVFDIPADIGSDGTAAARSTLANIFPGQLEHKTPLVLLGVSGPGLRGTAATFPRHLGTQSAQHAAKSLAAINSEGMASGPNAQPDLGLART